MDDAVVAEAIVEALNNEREQIAIMLEGMMCFEQSDYGGGADHALERAANAIRDRIDVQAFCGQSKTPAG